MEKALNLFHNGYASCWIYKGIFLGSSPEEPADEVFRKPMTVWGPLKPAVPPDFHTFRLVHIQPPAIYHVFLPVYGSRDFCSREVNLSLYLSACVYLPRFWRDGCPCTSLFRWVSDKSTIFPLSSFSCCKDDSILYMY